MRITRLLIATIPLLAAQLACAADGPLPAEKASAVAENVRCIDWKKISRSDNDDLRQSRKILLNAVRYNVPWLEARYPATPGGDSCVVSLPESARRHEHTIRPACSPVFALAVALRTGEWDEAATGISREHCLHVAKRTIHGVSAVHRANTDGKSGWGDHWQSALWSAMLSHGAWMLWDELEEPTRRLVVKLVLHEAGRFIAPGYKPLVWADREKVITPGNTRAEENAWDSMILHVAIGMMPKQPDARRWREAASLLMVNAFAMRADMDDATTKIDGRPVKDWLLGYNVRDDGAIINHSRAHPDYAACVFLSSRVFMTQALARENPPESGDFNSAKVYRMLAEKRWESPPHKAPGGTVLVPGRAEIYYPDGTDWSPFRYTEYYLLDTVAHYLGWDRGLPNRSLDWVRLRAAKCLEMQERHGDGHFYKRGEFDTYPGAEQSVLGCAADACLMHWLAACGAFRPKANWLAE